jgi:hypothetical protein
VNFQQVCCRICAKTILTQFEEDSDAGSDEVCSKNCSIELEWRKKLASEKKPYHPLQETRTIRIAELDPVQLLDSLVEDLLGVPDLKVDRYLMPKDVYHLFAAHPPPIGIDFPVATLEAKGEMTRVFGLNKVIAFLRELTIPSFAVTRKFRKKA